VRAACCCRAACEDLFFPARMRVTVALSDSESLTPHRQCETMPRTTSCWLQLAWAACSVACPSHSPDQAPKPHLARLSGDSRIAFCWHPLARYRPGDVPAGHRPGDVPVPLRPSQCSDVHRAVTGLLWSRTHGVWPRYFHVLICTVQSRFFCPGVCGRRPAGRRSARWREGGATPATAGPGGPGRRQPPRVSSPLRQSPSRRPGRRRSVARLRRPGRSAPSPSSCRHSGTVPWGASREAGFTRSTASFRRGGPAQAGRRQRRP
jgi:hypothetical protein